jgi:class 3 adenylate cyclase
MPTLPSGTLTLLFTDIEGSTRLLQDIGELYEQVLGEHRRILHSCFERKGGHVVDTQGDAFFVAFPRASDAVAAAVAAQRALVAHDWPGSATLRVRMGIHTGEPSAIGEGLVGLSVHRAARICSAAHGGQVLVSATTRDLVREHLPPGVVLLDLGEHSLKDIDHPELLAQLVIEGLPPVLTPPRTQDTQPTRATPFAGQEAQLARAAQAAIDEAPGGTGNVRVARKAVTRMLNWSQHVPMLGRGRIPDRIETLGFSIHAAARIAPREDLSAELRALGRALVAAARDARESDNLIRREDQATVSRRLADYRNSGGWEQDLRAADLTAAQLAALKRLVKSRREFEREARKLESQVRFLRPHVFDARIDVERRDELHLELRVLRERAEDMSARLHEAYTSARNACAETARHR